jgi:hypothetical protein
VTRIFDGCAYTSAVFGKIHSCDLAKKNGGADGQVVDAFAVDLWGENQGGWTPGE